MISCEPEKRHLPRLKNFVIEVLVASLSFSSKNCKIRIVYLWDYISQTLNGLIFFCINNKIKVIVNVKVVRRSTDVLTCLNSNGYPFDIK